MRWRVFFIVSLLLNGLLAVLLLLGLPAESRPGAEDHSGLRDPLLTNRPKPLVIIRRQFFTWAEVESPDYEKYIANLRDIGCPEATLRDIIVADVNQLYARRRATEIITVEQQWWRTEPDPEIEQTAAARIQGLDDERRALLTRLLGPTWDLDDTALLSALQPRMTLALDGAVLGDLAPDTKLKVREIIARQQERTRTYLESLNAAGRALDPAELGRIQTQTRTELAGLLTPHQLEEFLLRYSENAQNLRNQLGDLRHFGASAEEFRALFRVLDPLEQQKRLYYSGNDAASLRSRQTIEEQEQAALKNALSPERYALYLRLQDPLYRDAMDVAHQASSPGAVDTLYQVAQATAAERDQVGKDPSLSDAEKEIRLKEIELEQLKANLAALGQLKAPELSTPTVPRQPHVIQPNENWERLAAKYGVTVDELKALNPGRDLRLLRPGLTINVPPRPDLRFTPMPPPLPPR